MEKEEIIPKFKVGQTITDGKYHYLIKGYYDENYFVFQYESLNGTKTGFHDVPCIATSIHVSKQDNYRSVEDVDKEKLKKRIYISGPISDHEDVCTEAFDRIEKMLVDSGFRVFNPLKNGLPFNADTHLHMRRDLNVLTNEEDPFEYIFMMKRWSHSAGCTKELEVAISCGISVVYEESSTSAGVATVTKEGFVCIKYQ